MESELYPFWEQGCDMIRVCDRSAEDEGDCPQDVEALR